MATLQKLKLLATQCAVVSGSSSPVIHLHRRRRRKTLRMLLSRRPQDPPPHNPPQSPIHNNNNTQKMTIIINSPPNSSSSSTSLKLKDFLLSTSPNESPERERLVRERVPRGGGEGMVSFLRLGNLRQRLLRRKAFRPMLLTIPE